MSIGLRPNIQSVFEKHPKKTLIFVIVVCSIGLDLALARIVSDNSQCLQSSIYFHHGFKANCSARSTWGTASHDFFTNSLGMKDSSVKGVPLHTTKYRIIFLGDSFTEGVGYPYEKTFVGILNHKLRDRNIDFLNAGVRSYSPKLYYFKLLYLVNIGLKIDEIFVCIDLSDVPDEIVYESFSKNYPGWRTMVKITSFLRQNSFSFRTGYPLLRRLKNKYLFSSYRDEVGDLKTNFWNNEEQFYLERDKWDCDDDIYEKWGKKGVKLCLQHMNDLVDLCMTKRIKVNIVVYPWPTLILRHSLAGRYISLWKSFADERNVSFINLVPSFCDGASEATSVERYFINADVHFNEAGHYLVANSLHEYLIKNRSGW
jgi:hypothetical protein